MKVIRKKGKSVTVENEGGRYTRNASRQNVFE